MEKITETLTGLFELHRIVFWYDTKRELREEYDGLTIPGVEKIELDNNEYGVKYEVLRNEPKHKFLLYHEGPQPVDADNWLLDVQLAEGTFSADQVSLWLTELGLRREFFPLVQKHAVFFKAASRRNELKVRLIKDDDHNAIRAKMLSICANSASGSHLDGILEALLSELAAEREEKIVLIKRCALEEFLWEKSFVRFGYKSNAPSVRDFVFDLFKSCFALKLGQEAALTQDALIFLERWKDGIHHRDTYEKLSEDYARDPALERDLDDRDFRALIEIDYFRLIDLKILSDLAHQVAERTISAGECEKLIWSRRNTHWFSEFSDIYEAINYASRFIAQLGDVDLRMQSLADGIKKYQNIWYRLDQFYRKFIFHVRASKQTTLLENLIGQIEGLYSNNYLLPVNDNWQQIVDQIQSWEASPFPKQEQFFHEWVTKRYLNQNNKVAVLISDALRLEIGLELVDLIEQENRFAADPELMLGILPSYTQLGMAALLPHGELEIGKEGAVRIDGINTAGADNRAKILAAAIGNGATAIGSADLLALTGEESRTLFRDHSVVYIYHNQIDATGDDRTTEGRVFDAAEDALTEIVDIIKKLASANFTNILITTDHGFIYQNKPLDESEFVGLDVQGDEILVRSRRFVVGSGIKTTPSARKFGAGALGLAGGYEVSIPKSINRLRVKGAGSRYVHGGASLQEVVLPVITVKKKRASDVGMVDVEILTGTSTVITSGQLSVAFYQVVPVSAKCQARKLRAGIYTQKGDLISNTEELNFDFASENSREREVRSQFVLSRKAEDVNNQTVFLKLEERVPGTSHSREYRSLAFQLRRSFTSDFDF
jgi:uncharacterized protein (TIGR02687 family)